ncbi:MULTISPECIES: hypothetical protein, partial [Streptomyces]
MKPELQQDADRALEIEVLIAGINRLWRWKQRAVQRWKVSLGHGLVAVGKHGLETRLVAGAEREFWSSPERAQSWQEITANQPGIVAGE